MNMFQGPGFRFIMPGHHENPVILMHCPHPLELITLTKPAVALYAKKNLSE
jgi:hypothetical protein